MFLQNYSKMLRHYFRVCLHWQLARIHIYYFNDYSHYAAIAEARFQDFGSSLNRYVFCIQPLSQHL